MQTEEVFLEVESVVIWADDDRDCLAEGSDSGMCQYTTYVVRTERKSYLVVISRCIINFP